MGKSRDREIEEHGGKKPDENLGDEEILQQARQTYFDRKELPPDLQRILDDED